uniref:Tachykinin-related peptide 3 n=3 Tax=Panheteroptera TaxID=33351 RepID=TRP3_RHOPR|nr:RecName: Full=Tachykinin-related peptide 3; Short=Rhopr-TRP-3; Contains: RecName: Full=Tachykinin-related peptide 3(3-10); Short=Rhopr-TRP-3(3-10); Contains: RecName: Full=Tachykinin-related peptide 3(4-10); Short=Rhopr-TRP-3(4-10) [Rhodnius prolixus]P86583.1 RecName: Full=Tachykinin-related peptide 2; Short=TKRP-2 [Oncopeltus fasciatus]P86595.1 RecName: Full=Tachykinin-related peptide 2; Short=TKRP-2 [Pyrrhocoris apterus]
APASGFFGMR